MIVIWRHIQHYLIDWLWRFKQYWFNQWDKLHDPRCFPLFCGVINHVVILDLHDWIILLCYQIISISSINSHCLLANWSEFPLHKQAQVWQFNWWKQSTQYYSPQFDFNIQRSCNSTDVAATTLLVTPRTAVPVKKLLLCRRPITPSLVKTHLPLMLAAYRSFIHVATAF